MSGKENGGIPEIIITMGDPSGIGPEIIAKSVKEFLGGAETCFTVVGDKEVLSRAFSDHCPEALTAGRDRFSIDDVGESSGEIIPGRPSEKGAAIAFKAIQKAVDIISEKKAGRSRAMVTGPVSKENIGRVSPGFVGHTEFLQSSFKSDFVTMAFVGEHLRVVPVTRHVRLKDVASRLSRELIVRTIAQVVEERAMMSDEREPEIIVTALNPHAGEGGRVGTEEKEIIEPAIEEARAQYGRIEGAVPSDVAFYRALSSPGSIVVAMYHDQCLGPFKMIDFTSGVNLTLGLGIVRTSPDHGTAFDIAGRGLASPDSMTHAIKLAVRALRVSS